MANFETAIKVVLEHEGGYVNDPDDPGGETKYGISKRSYPKLDIKNLTVQQAKEIYYTDFWIKNKFDKIISDDVAQKCFDTSVNIGSLKTITLIQRTCNLIDKDPSRRLKVDGVIGSKTLAFVNTLDESEFLFVFRDLQAEYYKALVRRKPKKKKFLQGWLNRAAS